MYCSKMASAISSYFLTLKLYLCITFHVSMIVKREIPKVNAFYKNTCYLKISTLLRKNLLLPKFCHGREMQINKICFAVNNILNSKIFL